MYGRRRYNYYTYWSREITIVLTLPRYTHTPILNTYNIVIYRYRYPLPRTIQPQYTGSIHAYDNIRGQLSCHTPNILLLHNIVLILYYIGTWEMYTRKCDEWIIRINLQFFVPKSHVYTASSMYMDTTR